MTTKNGIQDEKVQSEEEIQKESYLPLMFVRGIPYPGSDHFRKENIEAVLDFQPRDTDILINSYPKCGTNWVKYIVHTIITRGQKPLKSYHQLCFEAVPYVDLSGLAPVENLPDPRPIHYHLSYDMVPKAKNTKYIYIFRNPKDAVVSFYQFLLKREGALEFTFDDYLDNFLKGFVIYGDYFDHVLSWYEHRNDPNVLFLSYEQLQADIKGQLLKIAKFIGETYYEELVEDNELLEKILQFVSFQNMKKVLTTTEGQEKQRDSELESSAPPALGKDLNYNFRNGIIGDWKNHFSPEQNSRMEARIQQKFRGTEIIDMYCEKRT